MPYPGGEQEGFIPSLINSLFVLIIVTEKSLCCKLRKKIKSEDNFCICKSTPRASQVPNVIYPIIQQGECSFLNKIRITYKKFLTNVKACFKLDISCFTFQSRQKEDRITRKFYKIMARTRCVIAVKNQPEVNRLFTKNMTAGSSCRTTPIQTSLPICKDAPWKHGSGGAACEL